MIKYKRTIEVIEAKNIAGNTSKKLDEAIRIDLLILSKREFYINVRNRE